MLLLDARGRVLDEVSYGLQVSDLSIGRIGQDARWDLTQPTLGQRNQPQPTGNADGVRINEWLASSGVRISDDFIELYNGNDIPVSLGGLIFTDDLTSRASDHVVASLSFVAANGFVVFQADEEVDQGADHLNEVSTSSWSMCLARA